VKSEQFSKRQQFAAFPGSKIKITRRTFADGQEGTTIAGYPILWNAISSDRGGYKVKLAKNSATFTAPTLALWAHDFSRPLASTANNSLRIGAADDVGVPIEIDLLTTTTTGADAAAYIAAEMVTGMSFSMANGFEDYSEAEQDDETILTATKYTVDEITVCINPAFIETTIGIKPDEQPALTSTHGGMSRLAQAKIKMWRATLDSLAM